MPFYEVFHSYPLTADQRQSLASSITSLHCSAFSTPAFFVHVRFTPQDTSDANYFMAGKPHHSNSNRIVGVVRVSPSRSRGDFDALGAMIEDAWYHVVGRLKPKDADGVNHVEEEKRLIMVVFTPMVTIREGGMAIPEAGQEEGWLREQLPYVRRMAEEYGVEDFKDFQRELGERGIE